MSTGDTDNCQNPRIFQLQENFYQLKLPTLQRKITDNHTGKIMNWGRKAAWEDKVLLDNNAHSNP